MAKEREDILKSRPSHVYAVEVGTKKVKAEDLNKEYTSTINTAGAFKELAKVKIYAESVFAACEAKAERREQRVHV